MQVRTVLGFLAIPLKAAPSMVIIVFSVLLFIAVKAGLLGIWLGLLLITGLFNYTFILFDSVLNADAEPPVLSVEMMNMANAPRPLLLLAVALVVFFGSQAASYWFGTSLAGLAAAVCAALLPAMLAVQAVTGETWQALNLVTGVRLMTRLGADYAAVVGFVVAAALIGAWAFSLDAVPLILRIAVMMYLWLASFCFLGGVLRERASDIGLDDAATPDPLESDEAPARERQRAQLVDRIYAEWRGGAHVNAWRSVSDHVGHGPNALQELEWLYERVARWPDPRLANRLARELLPRLLAAKRNGEAVDLTRARLETDSDFRPTTSDDLVRLVGLARDAGDRPTARALLRDFERHFPQDPAQPQALLLSQQLER